MAVCSMMIIDDNEDDRYLLKRLIEKTKIKNEIFEAENGQLALDFFLAYEENVRKHPGVFPPILIFLDINMPVMGGFEFLEEFEKLKKRNKNLSSIVFAMFTSSEREEDIKKTETYSFVQGYVTKGSLSAEKLKELIRKKFPEIEFDAE